MNISMRQISAGFHTSTEGHSPVDDGPRRETDATKLVSISAAVQPAASMDISRDGRALARRLRNETTPELRYDLVRSAQEDLGKVNELIKKTNDGGELTDEERSFVDDAMRSITAANYAEKKTHVLTDSELDGTLKALKDHFTERAELYADLQRKKEAQRGADEQDKTAKLLARARQEDEEDQRIVDTLRETLEQEDEEREEEADTVSEDDEEHTTMSNVDAEEERESGKSLQTQFLGQALDMIDRNRERIDGVGSRARAEYGEAQTLDQAVESELDRISGLLENDELTEEEKLMEFKTSYDSMNQMFEDKTLADVAAHVDFDTWLVSRIEGQALI